MRWLVLLLVGCAHAPCAPAATHACTRAQLDRYLSACVDPETALVITCQQAAAAAPECTRCLRAGPLVDHAGSVEANRAGCRAQAGATCSTCDGDLRSVARLACE